MENEIPPDSRGTQLRLKAFALLKASLDYIRAFGVKDPTIEVSEDFITKAVKFHCQGRVFMFVATWIAVIAIPHKCPGGEVIATLATLWTLYTWIFVRGIQLPKKKEPGNSDDNPVPDLMDGLSKEVLPEVFNRRIKYVKTYSSYPAKTFIPDVILLTLLVIHTGGAFSMFLPLFLVLCTLGDYALIAWGLTAKRVFLLAFIFIPFCLVIFFSTETGRVCINYIGAGRIIHEPYWAPLETISVPVALLTALVYIGATTLSSYVLRHLLRVWIIASMANKLESLSNEEGKKEADTQ
jgi:hypothetical protein